MHDNAGDYVYEDGDDTVPYDDNFCEIMVNGTRIYLPDEFGLHDDADLPDEPEPDEERFVYVDWKGIRPDYDCLTKDHAISLAMALMEAVRRL